MAYNSNNQGWLGGYIELVSVNGDFYIIYD